MIVVAGAGVPFPQRNPKAVGAALAGAVVGGQNMPAVLALLITGVLADRRIEWFGARLARFVSRDVIHGVVLGLALRSSSLAAPHRKRCGAGCSVGGPLGIAGAEEPFTMPVFSWSSVKDCSWRPNLCQPINHGQCSLSQKAARVSSTPRLV
jgi:hypothetical protein